MQAPAQPSPFAPPAFVQHAGTHRPAEDDTLDWSGTINMAGTAANRPAAGRTNKGCYYFATDTSGGTLYRSDGATSTQVALGVTQSTAPNGTAGGALDGSYPNPGIAASVAGAGLAEASDVLSVNVTSPTFAITSDAVAFATGYQATFSGTSAPGSPSAGDHWYDTTNKLLKLYNGSVWITITPVSASVTTAQTRNNTVYGDLATAGPAVTVDTGTQALLTVSAGIAETVTAGAVNAMSAAVTGATTLAASDAWCVSQGDPANGRVSATTLLTGLTAGSNTFTAKYRSQAGTGQWQQRSITIVGIPT